MRMGVILAAAAALASTSIATAAGVQKLTVTMRDFGYTPNKITIEAGTPAEITIVNNGKLTHEFMLYAMPRDAASMMGGKMGHEWVEQTNYFKGVQATVEGGKVKRRSGSLFEINILPGKSATLTFTPLKKGTFEFSCMIADHYEAGPHGVLVVK